MNHEDKDLVDKIKAREIVNEIMQFGVTQYQIELIIKLLALELADRELMLKVSAAISPDIEVEDKPQITL